MIFRLVMNVIKLILLRLDGFLQFERWFFLPFNENLHESH
jgi:hypothetical protein